MLPHSLVQDRDATRGMCNSSSNRFENAQQNHLLVINGRPVNSPRRNGFFASYCTPQRNYSALPRRMQTPRSSVIINQTLSRFNTMQSPPINPFAIHSKFAKSTPFGDITHSLAPGNHPLHNDINFNAPHPNITQPFGTFAQFPSGLNSACGPFTTTSTQDWMNQSFLMSVICNQAQQIQSLMQNYNMAPPIPDQLETNKNSGNCVTSQPSPKQMEYFPTLNTSQSFSTPLRSEPTLASQFSNNLQAASFQSMSNNKNPNTYFQQMDMDQNQYKQPYKEANMFFPNAVPRRRKPSATFIPGQRIQNESDVFQQSIMMKHYSPSFKSPERTTQPLVSLSDYTDNSIHHHSDHEDPDYDNFTDKTTDIEIPCEQTICTLNNPSAKNYRQCKRQRRRLTSSNKPSTQHQRRRPRTDVLYKPPHRVASMSFLRRVLPWRQRKIPKAFGDLVHWDTLKIRTVIERNSRYKTIQIIPKNQCYSRHENHTSDFTKPKKNSHRRKLPATFYPQTAQCSSSQRRKHLNGPQYWRHYQRNHTRFNSNRSMRTSRLTSNEKTNFCSIKKEYQENTTSMENAKMQGHTQLQTQQDQDVQCTKLVAENDPDNLLKQCGQQVELTEHNQKQTEMHEGHDDNLQLQPKYIFS